MAKNRVTSNNPTKKKRDSFFTRPQQKFKSNKTDQRKENPARIRSKSGAQYSAGEQSSRPSLSSSDDFFVKPVEDAPLKNSLAENLQIQNAPTLEQGRNHLAKKYPQRQRTTSNNSGSERIVKQEKKPFDKKRYRLQKYSKKYKLQQWEQNRKQGVLRGYYRSLKDDEPKFDVQSIYEQYKHEIDDEDDKADEENENNLNEDNNVASTAKDEPAAPKNSKEKKGKAFKRAQHEFQRIRDEKQKKREEMLKRKAEKEEALQAYKKKKAEKFKKLSRKTKRGQPIMKDRIEMLLEKIQSSMK